MNNVSKDFFNEDGEEIAKYAIKRFEKEFNVNIDDYNAIDIVKESKYPILLSAGSNEHMDEELNTLKDNEEKTLHNIKSINQLTVNEINNVNKKIEYDFKSFLTNEKYLLYNPFQKTILMAL